MTWSSRRFRSHPTRRAEGPMDGRTMKEAIRFHFLYSMCGLVIGVLCIGGGVTLVLLGITGNTHFVADLFRVHSEVSDASPGVVLCFVGLLIVFVTRYEVRSSKSDGKRKS